MCCFGWLYYRRSTTLIMPMLMLMPNAPTTQLAYHSKRFYSLFSQIPNIVYCIQYPVYLVDAKKLLTQLAKKPFSSSTPARLRVPDQNEWVISKNLVIWLCAFYPLNSTLHQMRYTGPTRNQNRKKCHFSIWIYCGCYSLLYPVRPEALFCKIFYSFDVLDIVLVATFVCRALEHCTLWNIGNRNT